LIAGEAPYAVHVEESECAGGGNGVFVEGRAEEGEVLAVYRGVVYDPTSVESMHSFICPENEVQYDARSRSLMRCPEALRKPHLGTPLAALAHPPPRDDRRFRP